jgi:hypothetical protein
MSFFVPLKLLDSCNTNNSLKILWDDSHPISNHKQANKQTKKQTNKQTYKKIRGS